MNGDWKRFRDEGDRKPLAVLLPADLVSTLAEFCREKGVAPDLVVEHALEEYFREGDMSH